MPPADFYQHENFWKMNDRIPAWSVTNPITRRKSREVIIGNTAIGGNNPVRVQSMTNTDTMDTEATVSQCIALAEAGCEIVRITASNLPAAENLYNIKNELSKRGCQIPLIADIHFNPKAAEVAATIVEKVRINPGNYTDRNSGKTSFTDKEYEDEIARISERLSPLVEICKAHKTAMRIGTNHGSLSERIMSRYGNTPYAMAMSAMEFANVCHGLGYDNLVLSMKSSSVKTMHYATRILAALLRESGLDYPIHLGVTEAGNGQDGRVKSMAGIGSLLALGIGDTIRVSLTESPVNEIPVAKQIVSAYADIPLGDRAAEIELNSVFSRAEEIERHLEPAEYRLGETSLETILTNWQQNRQPARLVQTNPAMDAARLAGDVSALVMEGFVGGVELCDKAFEADLMQALGEKIYKAEFVACPSCGRTKYDIEAALEKVKQRCRHLKGLKIAVMGCIVNGPGEMSDADYGYIGSGEGKVHLYRSGRLAHSNVSENDAIEVLVDMIKEDGKWQDAE